MWNEYLGGLGLPGWAAHHCDEHLVDYAGPFHPRGGAPLIDQAATLQKWDDVEVISLVGFAHCVSHFFHLVFPPLFPWLMEEFSLGFTAVGMLVTVFFVLSGAGQVLAGFVVDRVGPRPVLLFGVAMLGASGLLLAAARDFSMLVFAAAVAGLGNSVFHPADYTLLNRRVSVPRLGHALSVHGLTGTLGWAIAPIFMVSIATATTWRLAGVAAAGVAFASLAAIVWRRQSLDLGDVATGTPAKSEGPIARPTALGFLRSLDVWMCFAFFLCWTLAFSALQIFTPALLGQIYGLAISVATSALTAYMLGNAAGTVAGGFLGKRSSPDRAVAGALTGAALLALVLATGAIPAAGAIPLMTLMGFGAGLAVPSRDLLVRKAAIAGSDAPSYGRIYGFVYSGFDTGLALAPFLFGTLMDGSRFREVLVGVAVFQALAIVTALRVGARAVGRGSA